MIRRQEITIPYFSICGFGPFISQAGIQEKGTKYVNAKYRHQLIQKIR